MKLFVLTISLISALTVHAALPTHGEYLCQAERAYNTPPSTVDTLKLLFWTSKNGNPTVKLSTVRDTHTLQPSIFGGSSARLMRPVEPKSCTSPLPYRQVLDCAQALLPALVDSENLFVRTHNVQAVHSVKISGNFSGFTKPNKNEDLAIQIEFRRDRSHWARIYSCTMMK